MVTDFFKLWFWPLDAARMGVQITETLMASQSVIEARMPMIGAAMSNPLQANHKELTQMVMEKGQAFGRSQRSVSAALDTVRKSSQANVHDLSRLSGGAFFGPADWMQMFERNMAAAVAISTMPAQALAPIHKRATANARRLTAKRAR
jgi:hypothetical protein